MNMDGEQRFSELIQPIRDLAVNWDIDIASSLEEYLEELETIKLTVKNPEGTDTLSFSLNI